MGVLDDALWEVYNVTIWEQELSLSWVWVDLFNHSKKKHAISYKICFFSKAKVLQQNLMLESLHHFKFYNHTAVQWQKEATLENDISCKWAKCVCHAHWHQCIIIISWPKYLSAGWMFLLQTWNGSIICYKVQ